MFLSLDEWRHPSRSVQALARPAVALECLSFAGTSPNLLIELIKKYDDSIHIEWIMSANFERLHALLASSPHSVGAVSVLISPCQNGTPSWKVERVIALREWLSGRDYWLGVSSRRRQLGFEPCSTTRCPVGKSVESSCRRKFSTM